jgi:hypothetical protein
MFCAEALEKAATKTMARENNFFIFSIYCELLTGRKGTAKYRDGKI